MSRPSRTRMLRWCWSSSRSLQPTCHRFASSTSIRCSPMWAVLSGQSRHEAARMVDVSARCVIKLMQRVDATGDCQPRKFGGHKRYALAEHEDKVRALVAEKPDLTITELWQKTTAHGIKAGRSAVARFLLHLQLTFKKKLCVPPSRNARMSRTPAPPGARCIKALTLKGLFLSTRPGPRPT